MQDFGEIFGSLGTTRITRRLSRRQHEDEARVNEVPPRPGHEKNLSEHVPSSLISLDDRVRALVVGGAPAWSRRLKRIHDLTDAATEHLRDEWQRAASAARGNADRFAASWTRLAERYDLARINELIAQHNRYFPAEANLAMDIKTLDYVQFGGADYRRQPLDASWILAQFPADLDAVHAWAARPHAGRENP